MTKFGTKLPETGTYLQVICLHDGLCPLLGSIDPNKTILKPFVYDGCNGVHSHAHKTLPRRSVWHETYRRARSDQTDTKPQTALREALRPVRSIARIKTFAKDGYLCWIALIEPDVENKLVFHER